MSSCPVGFYCGAREKRCEDYHAPAGSSPLLLMTRGPETDGRCAELHLNHLFPAVERLFLGVEIFPHEGVLRSQTGVKREVDFFAHIQHGRSRKRCVQGRGNVASSRLGNSARMLMAVRKGPLQKGQGMDKDAPVFEWAPPHGVKRSKLKRSPF